MLSVALRADIWGACPLVSTADNYVIEVLTDSTIQKFAPNARGHGTAEENQAAMAGGKKLVRHTHTVDENGGVERRSRRGLGLPELGR